MGSIYSIAVKGCCRAALSPACSASEALEDSNLIGGKTARIDGEFASLFARYFESPRIALIASRINPNLKVLGAGSGKASKIPSFRAETSAPGTTSPRRTATLASRVASTSKIPEVAKAC
jgi:hypothetical protein